MGIFDSLKGLPEGEPAERTAVAIDAESFVYVMIPGNIMPLERGDHFEDPIDHRFGARSLGGVTGGGSKMGVSDADGNPTVEYCGIDIEVTDLAAATGVIELSRTVPPHLGRSMPLDVDIAHEFTVDAVQVIVSTRHTLHAFIHELMQIRDRRCSREFHKCSIRNEKLREHGVHETGRARRLVNTIGHGTNEAHRRQTAPYGAIPI